MKEKDGYVLIYVVFVIIILCAAASWLCSAALGGIRRQNEAVQQMQNRYAAESSIEKFAAKASVSRDDSIERSGFESEQAARNAATAEFESLLAAAAGEMNVAVYDVRWNGDNCLVDLAAQAEDSGVSASVEFSLQIEADSLEEVEETVFEYSIAAVTSRYVRYEREMEGGGS